MTSLFEIQNLSKYYEIRQGLFNKVTDYIKAVDRISLTINEGETIGIIGESGCGKTVLFYTMMLLEEPTTGKIFFKGQDISNVSKTELKVLRRNIQLIFQNYGSALPPKMRIGQILEETLLVNKLMENRILRKDRVIKTMEMVGLTSDLFNRYPHELSGGQQQRVVTAKALILHPAIVFCDELVSALDVSIQAQVLNLFKELQDELNLTYLISANDLAVLRYIADRIVVMYRGRFIEIAPNDILYKKPLHPYTQLVLEASPSIERNLSNDNNKMQYIENNIAETDITTSGCLYYSQCSYSFDKCKIEPPELVQIEPEHYVACHLVTR